MRVHCAECGAEVPAGTPDGHCFRCLFSLGLELPAAGEPTSALDLAPLLARPHAPLAVKFHRLGDYELVQEIARGGMGVVFRARQASLNRPVALKFIQGGRLASPALVRRFRVEAEAAAALQHPDIVSVFEIGEFDGHHFYSMELIVGDGLNRRMSDFALGEPDPAMATARSSAARSRSQQERIAALVATVARAVDFAHQHGVLHRDLKPSNIVMDVEGRPHLTDFGLAKLLHEDETQFTVCGTVLGTPDYMAPELARGGAQQATTGSDIYSLGAILYELLTGHPPFQAPTAVEVWRRAADEEPASPVGINPRVDRDLETICLRCLEKTAANRYPTALALAEDLEHWIAREPITARPVTFAERVSRWVRRQPAVAALSLIALALALGGFAGVFSQWHRAEQAAYTTRLHLYAADMGAAGQALAEGNFGRARELLDGHRPEPGGDDARGFEWRLLQQRAQGQHVAALVRHSNIVNAVAFSGDGRWLATGGEDAQVHVWQLSQHALARSLTGHTGGVNGLAFSPDSRMLATAAQDGWIRLWDTATWQVTTQLAARAFHVEFSPAEPLLVYSEGGSINGASGRVRLWRWGGAGPDRTWNNGNRFALTPDGRQLLIGNNEQLTLWDIATGQPLGQSPLALMTLSLALSPLPNVAAACSFQGEVRLFQLPGLTPSPALPGLSGRARAVAFSRDGLLAAAGSDQTIQVWNTADSSSAPRVHRTLRGHGSGVRSMAFAPDGRFLASGDKQGAVLLWDMRSTSEATTLTNSFANYASPRPVFSSDGRLMAAASALAEVSVWDLHSCERQRAFPGAAVPLAFLDSPPRLRALGSNFTWQVWDTVHGSLESETAFVRPDKAFSAALTADGSRLAVGYENGSVAFYDPRSGKELWQRMSHRAAVRDLVFTRDARRLITGSQDRTATIWEVNDNGATARATLTGHSDLIFDVELSPDERTIATACGDHTVRLWDAETGRALGVLTGHREGVARVAFSRDGRTLASGSDDDTVRLWHVATQREMLRLEMRGNVMAVAFAPDDETLVATSVRRFIQRFEAPAFSGLEREAQKRIW